MLTTCTVWKLRPQPEGGRHEGAHTGEPGRLPPGVGLGLLPQHYIQELRARERFSEPCVA